MFFVKGEITLMDSQHCIFLTRYVGVRQVLFIKCIGGIVQLHQCKEILIDFEGCYFHIEMMWFLENKRAICIVNENLVSGIVTIVTLNCLVWDFVNVKVDSMTLK